MEGGKKVAFIGDLHFYDGQTKSHKDYHANCLDCMNRYTEEFERTKPDYIFMAGDLIGLSERVMRTRVGLTEFIAYMKKWSDICNGNLYSVAGNHDYTKGENMADFDFITFLGTIKQSRYIDVNGARIHMVNYGAEREPLDIADDKFNIALTHADLQIDGATTWFHASDEAIQLSSLKNFKGVGLVLGGHIHNPSPRTVTTSIEDKEVSLVYLGCAARPKRKDTWTGVYVAYADCMDNGAINLDLSIVNLKPCDEIFNPVVARDTEEYEDVLEDKPVVDIELLTKILDELSPALMSSEYDYRTQIKKMAGIDTEAAELAISYIDKADEMCKVAS